MNHPLKKTLAKLRAETHAPWTNLPLTVLLRVRVAPRSGLKLSPLEMTYGRPFLTTDILLDEEVNQTLRNIILGQVQKVIQDYAYKALPAPTENTEEGAVPSQINPGDPSSSQHLERGLPQRPTIAKMEGQL